METIFQSPVVRVETEPQIPLIVSTNLSVASDSIIVERSSDVEPILDYAKALHNEGFDTTGMGDKLAAEYDPVIVEKYCNDNGITFQEWMNNPEHVRRMLNDPDLSAFRVWKGRV